MGNAQMPDMVSYTALSPSGGADLTTTTLDVDIIKTSLLLRNLPDGCTRSKVMYVLRTLGLTTDIDFLYTPGNLKVKQSCGYAFVNYTTSEAAMECMEKLHGFNDWGVQSEKVCEVEWCSDHNQDF